MSREGYFTIGQIATKMGVSEATVWSLVKRRQVDRFKFPGDRKTYIAEGSLGTLMEPEKLPGTPQVGRPRGSVQGKAAA